MPRTRTIAVAALVLLLTVIANPALAKEDKGDNSTQLPRVVAPGGTPVVVASKSVVLKSSSTTNGIAPKYALAYGSGETTLTHEVFSANCIGYSVGHGKTTTAVNKNDLYDPEAIGSFTVNGYQYDVKSSNREYFFDTASWTTKSICSQTNSNWQQNSTHKIWQTTLGVSNLVTNQSFYVVATF